MIHKIRNTPLAVLGALVLAGSPLLSSQILIDRGLPTINLNNAAGANRSNVGWAFTNDADATDTWLVGDTFSNTAAGIMYLETIRVWTTGQTNSASLWGGLSGASSFAQLSSTYVASAVQYDGGLDYQGSSGSMITMTQLDFSVNIALGIGETFSFFFDGARDSLPFVPFLHASNGALSGSPQDGADDTMLYALRTGATIDAANTGTWTSLGNGWDKASDINVQVIGRVPDSSSSALLLGISLLGLCVAQRRMKRR